MFYCLSLHILYDFMCTLWHILILTYDMYLIFSNEVTVKTVQSFHGIKSCTELLLLDILVTRTVYIIFRFFKDAIEA